VNIDKILNFAAIALPIFLLIAIIYIAFHIVKELIQAHKENE